MCIGKFKNAALFLVVISAVGCTPRSKAWESFESATNPNPPSAAPNNRAADIYGSAGSADSSGGRLPATSYGQGARTSGTPPLNPSYDQPAKGTGQQPGEYDGNAAPGFGKSNAPGLQPSPSDASSSTSTTQKN